MSQKDAGTGGDGLSADAVRKVARLSRLALSDEQLAEQRTRLVAVLGYVERLREMDLEGVEPLTHPGAETNRLDEDEPRKTLPPDALTKMAPASFGAFVKVPKVLGDGGGA